MRMADDATNAWILCCGASMMLLLGREAFCVGRCGLWDPKSGVDMHGPRETRWFAAFHVGAYAVLMRDCVACAGVPARHQC